MTKEFIKALIKALISVSLCALPTYLSSQNRLPFGVDTPILSDCFSDLRALKENNPQPIDTMYLLPKGLRCLGTIDLKKDGRVVANYLSFNKQVNNGIVLWAPTNEPICYPIKNPDKRNVSWNVQGDPTPIVKNDTLKVTCLDEGVYDYPKADYRVGNVEKSFSYTGKILVGGKGEICLCNTSKLGNTYQIGIYPLKSKGDDSNAGYLGGPNTVGIEKYGNLFMTAQKNAYILGVRVYFQSKPKEYTSEDRLLLRVWYPQSSDSEFKLEGIPLEASFVNFSEIRSTNTNESPFKSTAVAEFRFEQPLQIYDKPMFFVSVEKFGKNINNNNFCMLTETKGYPITEVQSGNMLSHNSFVYYSKNYFPINYFGAAIGASFMICPVVSNNPNDVMGVSLLKEKDLDEIIIKEDRVDFLVSSDNELIRIYNLNGKIVAEQKCIDSGSYYLSLKRGIYVVVFTKRDQSIVTKKIIINN